MEDEHKEANASVVIENRLKANEIFTELVVRHNAGELPKVELYTTLLIIWADLTVYLDQLHAGMDQAMANRNVLRVLTHTRKKQSDTVEIEAPDTWATAIPVNIN